MRVNILLSPYPRAISLSPFYDEQNVGVSEEFGYVQLDIIWRAE